MLTAGLLLRTGTAYGYVAVAIEKVTGSSPRAQFHIVRTAVWPIACWDTDAKALQYIRLM